MIVLEKGLSASKARFDDYKEAVYILTQLIEPGRVVTYGCLARALGVSPRLVGRVLAINENIVVVPCHRVVGKKNLGGFSLGLSFKEKLLAIEGLKSSEDLRRALIDCRDIEELLSKAGGRLVFSFELSEESEG
ncbi:MAG: MGMT family protein [Acidilobaceae archaeon]